MFLSLFYEGRRHQVSLWNFADYMYCIFTCLLRYPAICDASDVFCWIAPGPGRTCNLGINSYYPPEGNGRGDTRGVTPENTPNLFSRGEPTGFCLDKYCANPGA